MKNSTRGFLAVIMGLALAGCGGGGGGGDDDSASKVYPGPTDEPVVKNQDDAANLAMNVKESLDSFGFRQSASSLGGPKSIWEIGDYFRNGAPLGKAVAKAETLDCPGGGTYTTDAGGDGTKGSYWYVEYDNCVDGNITISGSQREDVVAGDATTDNSTTTLTVDHYRREDASGNYIVVHGQLTATETDDYAGNTSESVSGPGLYYGFHVESTDLDVLYADFAFARSQNSAGDTTFTEDLTISSSLIGGTVVVDTTTPFLTPAINSNPQSGRVVVSVAGGDKVRVTADGAARSDEDHVTIEWDLDDVEGYEGSKETYWYSDWSV